MSEKRVTTVYLDAGLVDLVKQSGLSLNELVDKLLREFFKVVSDDEVLALRKKLEVESISAFRDCADRIAREDCEKRVLALESFVRETGVDVCGNLEALLYWSRLTGKSVDDLKKLKEGVV